MTQVEKLKSGDVAACLGQCSNLQDVSLPQSCEVVGLLRITVIRSSTLTSSGCSAVHEAQTQVASCNGNPLASESSLRRPQCKTSQRLPLKRHFLRVGTGQCIKRRLGTPRKGRQGLWKDGQLHPPQRRHRQVQQGGGQEGEKGEEAVHHGQTECDKPTLNRQHCAVRRQTDKDVACLICRFLVRVFSPALKHHLLS